MPYQQTSLFAYREVQKNINERQKKVLECFQDHISLNNRQIKELLGWEINCVTGRVNELVKTGILMIDRKDLDPHTGRPTIFWKKCA